MAGKIGRNERAIWWDYRLGDTRSLMLRNIDGKISELHGELQGLAQVTTMLFKEISNDIRRNIRISKKSAIEKGPEFKKVELRNTQVDLKIQNGLDRELIFVKERLSNAIVKIDEILKESSVDIIIDKKIEQELMDLGNGKISVARMPLYK